MNALTQPHGKNHITAQPSDLSCRPPPPPVKDGFAKTSSLSFAWGDGAGKNKKNPKTSENAANCVNNETAMIKESTDKYIKHNRVSWCDLNDEDSDEDQLINVKRCTERRNCHKEERLHHSRYHNSALRDHSHLYGNDYQYSTDYSRDFHHGMNRYPRCTHERKDDRLNEYYGRQIHGHHHDPRNR